MAEAQQETVLPAGEAGTYLNLTRGRTRVLPSRNCHQHDWGRLGNGQVAARWGDWMEQDSWWLCHLTSHQNRVDTFLPPMNNHTEPLFPPLVN